MQAGDISEEDAAAQIRDLISELKTEKHVRGIASHCGSRIRVLSASPEGDDPKGEDAEAEEAPEATPSDEADSRQEKADERDRSAVLRELTRRTLEVAA
jgi:hypothetical protein